MGQLFHENKLIGQLPLSEFLKKQVAQVLREIWKCTESCRTLYDISTIYGPIDAFLSAVFRRFKRTCTRFWGHFFAGLRANLSTFLRSFEEPPRKVPWEGFTGRISHLKPERSWNHSTAWIESVLANLQAMNFGRRFLTWLIHGWRTLTVYRYFPATNSRILNLGFWASPHLRTSPLLPRDPCSQGRAPPEGFLFPITLMFYRWNGDKLHPTTPKSGFR